MRSGLRTHSTIARLWSIGFTLFHHAPTDSLCRDYCNPCDVVNTGTVHVHRRSRVDDAGDRPRLSDGIGVEVCRQIMLPNGVHKSVSRITFTDVR